jgi:cysteine desulfurase
MAWYVAAPVLRSRQVPKRQHESPMTDRIYLDHAATTPLDPRVLEAMLPALTGAWGNPSSTYREGRAARKAMDMARRSVAEILGARPAEVVWTGGGSEADSLAIRGVVGAAGGQPHVITTAIEHHAVLHTVQALEREGACRATYLSVDAEGVVDLDELERSMAEDTVLVSLMYANNEIGSIQPIAEAVHIARRSTPGVVVHSDAVQAAGCLDLSAGALGVDLLSMAAHKFYGPKGVGALYVRAGTSLRPQTLGGAQERNRRAGTENVAGAVGLAAALRFAVAERSQRSAHEATLRNMLVSGLAARVPGVYLNGPPPGKDRLPNNANFSIDGVESEALLVQLDLLGVAASSGSACTSGSLEPSHVLTAIGRNESLARNSLRLTVGKDNTVTEIEHVLGLLPHVIDRLRGTIGQRVEVGVRAVATPRATTQPARPRPAPARSTPVAGRRHRA